MRFCENIKRKNISISNKKFCKNQNRRKFKVSLVRSTSKGSLLPKNNMNIEFDGFFNR